MEEEDFVENSQVFWGIKVEPGKKEVLEIPDDSYVNISAVCLGELVSDDIDKPSILKAQVETVLIDQIDHKTQEAPITKADINVAVLRPEICEHTPVAYVFSQINNVTFEVEGPNPVYISGTYEDMDEDEDDDEEEEEEEEVNEKQLNEKLMGIAKKKKN